MFKEKILLWKYFGAPDPLRARTVQKPSPMDSVADGLLAKLPKIPEKFTDPKKFPKTYRATRNLAKLVVENWKIEEWMHKIDGIEDLCPGYAERDAAGKREFWVVLLTAMASYESGYDPGKVFYEGDYDDRASMQKDSVGLLQLSLDDGDGPYGKLDGWMIGGKDNTDLTNPYKNLSSGFAVMKFWMERDGTLGEGTRKGLGRYWSVMRDKKKANTKYGKYEQVKATVKANLKIKD